VHNEIFRFTLRIGGRYQDAMSRSTDLMEGKRVDRRCRVLLPKVGWFLVKTVRFEKGTTS
jgi:hypothetical protein